ncbi:MAG TPA: NADH:ubiquinone reductase (Na(+)-transporting) subunit C, partial [Myxococcota bacterium]|nr:NADH:ubiquinone reductase (Na(+)-transporting) subunit C [Myxococcota bacterium]
MQYGKRYTILFAAAVCGVFAILVTSSAVLLKDRQEENFRLDRMKNVLTVAGLMEPGQKLGRTEIQKIFDENIESRLIELKTGQYVTDGPEPAGYDQRKATADAATSLNAPDNRAGLVRLPKMGLVYLIKDRQGVRPFSGLLLPIEGKGLWSTLYGYLALESDLNTIRGITYYQHGETPGLGGEV